MKSLFTYKVQADLKPSNLDGITNNQINDHWKLYEGYVSQTNKINEDLEKLENGTLAHSDRRRRLGFEYNGMVLHEYYFGNLKSNIKISDKSKLKKSIENHWGSFEEWLEDFKTTGKTRGIGWAILYIDPITKQLKNHFIAEHENGHISGFLPIIVMDVWEHAYMVDHGATKRGSYIDSFVKNINWEVVENRFEKADNNNIPNRF